jgi:hypothetical protein
VSRSASQPRRTRTRTSAWTAPAKGLSYWSVVRTATKVARTFDPKPYPARRGLTPAEIAGIDAARDPEGVALRQQRADRLQSMMLVGCFAALPRKIRKAWRGDITLDGTVVPIYGKFGHNSKRRVNEDSRSPEVLSGWHAKDRDQRDVANLPGQKPAKDWTHGYDAHIALMTTRADDAPMPPLILALSLDTPGSKPGLNAAAALAGIVDAGLPAGWVTTDLGYSQLLPENFALPVRALGFELMHMFKQDELGVIQASWKGLICVEGTVYGPCLPDVLRNASVDHAAKRIDDQTHLTRIDARRAYQARVKAGRDGARVVRLPLPRRRPSPDSPLRPQEGAYLAGGDRSRQAQDPAAGGERTIGPSTVLREQRLCIRAGQRVRAVRHRTAVQDTRVEEALPRHPQPDGRQEPVHQEPARRRHRLVGGAPVPRLRQAAVRPAHQLVSANIQTLVGWLDAQDSGENEQPTKRRGRRPEPGLDQYRPRPTGPPIRIVGPAPAA